MDCSPWWSKNGIGSKNFMQEGVHVKCMHNNFGGQGLSGFRDIATFKFGQFPFGPWSMVVKKFNQLKSAQKVHASRDRCQMHAHQFWWV